MAKRQTRRSISFNKGIYAAVTREAAAAGVSCSEWITRLVRAVVPDLPETKHADADTPREESTGRFRSFHRMTSAEVAGAMYRMSNKGRV